ncbi:Signal transduction histidine kinase [Rhodoferax sp. OV413]|uniref:CHASE3 domain-containing protein n=1 Tax=Rhodoferax sp. OV413 TaxID=1855285 RepID=UPI000890DD68|nr:CHASE3 domain-containing protein [Rhodoferax sp. OV413]SDP46306.1 Signal transduction histidine kinase [Rhodoferax sp. OV413]
MNFINVVKRNRIVFVLACTAALSIVLISEGSYLQSVAILDKLGSMGQARTTIQSLTKNILDAETGQRGYLVTNRKEYREPYDAALQKINESLQFLDVYYRGQRLPTDVLGKLHNVTDTRLSELALTIKMHDEGKDDAVKDIVMSDIGKEQMDTIRKLTDELLEYETQNVNKGRSEIYGMLMFNRGGVAALTALSLLALFMYFRQIFLFREQQLEIQRMVQVERDRLEVEVVQRTAQLTELTHHLQTAREDERHRLARNLHDDLGALLTSAKLDAARIRSRLGGTAPEALELLTHLVGTLNSGIALGRRIIEDLRPSALSNLGLVSTLEILAREFADQSTVQVHCSLEPVELKTTAELMVYRLVQEAITNITKYAKAQNVWVTLGTRDGQVEVSVRDDGVGFDTSAKPQSAYGLVGMRFRVEAEGGVLTMVSGPGRGTLIQARLPISVAIPAATESST